MILSTLFRRSAPIWADVAIAGALFVGFSLWAVGYWKSVTTHGQPFYYQLYFEPAVMVACGKGYVVARPQVPAMVDFLTQRVDAFSCAAIPANAPLGTEDMFQFGSWRYLMLTVAATWRVFGVAWSALGPLFGVLFGATIAASYAIFRLGMGPLLAVICATALRFALMLLKYLPVLRDFTKAPFILVLLFLLGLLVVSAPARRRVLAIAAAFGLAAGIGYGFRTDLIAYLPAFVVTVFAFLPGGTFRNLGLKAAATALATGLFILAAWPVISTLETARSGCGWHVILEGFARQFDEPLGITPAPYEVSREYLDEWVYTTVTSYAARVHPGVGHFGWCETPYSIATREYLTDVVKRFPADAIVRIYASILRVVELPFAPAVLDNLGDHIDWSAGHGFGLTLVLAAMLIVAAADLRLGLFLAFFLLFFGGMPALQFDHRHFFHLLFITWWAGGFLVQWLVTGERTTRGLGRAALTLSAIAAALVAVLWMARAYQQPAVRSLMSEYLAAPRDQVPAPQLLNADQGIRTAPHADPEIADYVVVDLVAARCTDRSTVSFRYEDAARRAYGRSFRVARATGPGLAHILMPVYEGFSRLDFVDVPPGCLDGVYRLRDPRRFPLLVEASVAPDWRKTSLYQRLSDD